MTVSLPRDVATVVQLVWSPSELYELDAKCDVLRAQLAPLLVTAEQLHGVRGSTLAASFDTLHRLFNPSPAVPATTQLVPDAMCGGVVTWADRDTQGSAPSKMATQHKDGGAWFRVRTSFAQRAYCVERSAGQVATLLQALSYSFPHLLVPYSDQPVERSTAAVLAGDAAPLECRVQDERCVSEQLVGALCSFVMAHTTELAAYMPVLYFFYEQQETKAALFFTLLRTLLEQNKLYETTLFANLCPPVARGWFSFASSAPTAPKGSHTLSIADAAQCIADHVAELPKGFSAQYMGATVKKAQLERLLHQTQTLQRALGGEAEALIALAAALHEVPVHLPDSMMQWYEPPRSEAATTEAGRLTPSSSTTRKDDGEEAWDEVSALHAEVRGASAGLTTMLRDEGALRQSRAGPLLQPLRDALAAILLRHSSTWHYLHEYLSMKHVVLTNAALVSQQTPLPRGCPAATSPALLRQVADLHKSYRQMLRTIEARMDDELAASAAAVVAEKKLCCMLCSAMQGLYAHSDNHPPTRGHEGES